MNDTLLIALIVGVPATLTATATLIVAIKSKNLSEKNSEKIEQVHKLINSGLTVRLEESKETGRLQGKEEQRKEDKT